MRLAFIVLAAASGAGVVAYGLFWVFAPQNPYEAGRPRDRERDLTLLLALGSLTVGGVLLLAALGFGFDPAITLPLVVVGVGVAILWRQADDDARERWRQATATHRLPGAARAAIGIALVVIGAVAILVGPARLGRDPGGLVAAVVVGGRDRAGERPVVGADGPRPGRRAQRPHPRAGARRGRGPRARLRPAHAHPDPATRGRPARGRPAGPRPGARAARLALPADRQRPGRHATSSGPP